MSISNSPRLVNASFAALQTCHGTFNLTNNDKLNLISAPVLSEVNGNINITGALTDVGMPDVHTVQGPIYLSSSEDFAPACSRFGLPNPNFHSPRCQGQFDPALANQNPLPSTSDSSPTTSVAGAFDLFPAVLFGTLAPFLQITPDPEKLG